MGGNILAIVEVSQGEVMRDGNDIMTWERGLIWDGIGYI